MSSLALYFVLNTWYTGISLHLRISHSMKYTLKYTPLPPQKILFKKPLSKQWAEDYIVGPAIEADKEEGSGCRI